MLCKICLVAVLALGASLWGADPAIGKWKMEPGLSRVRDPQLWGGRVIIVEPAGKDSHRITVASPDKHGQTTMIEDIRVADGEERPDKRNSDRTIKCERVDDWTTRTTWNKGGKPVKLIVSSISQDGTRMTEYVIGRDDKGSYFQEKRVFRRQ